jgi:hypothetical protein
MGDFCAGMATSGKGTMGQTRILLQFLTDVSGKNFENFIKITVSHHNKV